jgi:hypothetical protein
MAFAHLIQLSGLCQASSVFDHPLESFVQPYLPQISIVFEKLGGWNTYNPSRLPTLSSLFCYLGMMTLSIT